MVRQLLKNVPSNQYTRLVSANFLLFIVSAGLSFILGLALARVLGPEGFGAYDYADSWVEILLLVVLFGFDRLLIRKIHEYEHQDKWAQISGIWRFAVRVVALNFVVIAAVFSVIFVFMFKRTDVWNWSFDIFPTIIQSDRNEQLLLASLMALLVLGCRAVLRLAQGLLHSFDYVTYGLIPDYLIRPLVFVVLLIIVMFLTDQYLPAWFAVVFHLLGSLAGVAFAIYNMWRYIPHKLYQTIPHYLPIEWLKSNVALVTVVVTSLLTTRVGIVLLGTFSSLDQVSFFGVSSRIATAIILIQTAVNITIQPRVAQVYSQNDFHSLQKVVTSAVRTVSIISVPTALGIIVFGHEVLRIFGEQFVDAYPILVILCVSQIFVTIAGPVGNILMMTGHEVDLAVINSLVAGGTILLSLFLIPEYEAFGAALASGVGSALLNLILSVVVFIRLGIITLPIPIRFSGNS